MKIEKKHIWNHDVVNGGKSKIVIDNRSTRETLSLLIFQILSQPQQETLQSEGTADNYQYFLFLSLSLSPSFSACVLARACVRARVFYMDLNIAKTLNRSFMNSNISKVK